jgi:ketosteroid isomerase-like protein
VISLQVTGREQYRGHAGYWEWVKTMEESFETWRLEPEHFEELGDAVLVLGSMHLRGRASGVELDQETGWIVDVRDGVMLRLRTFISHAEAREAFEHQHSRRVE